MNNSERARRKAALRCATSQRRNRIRALALTQGWHSAEWRWRAAQAEIERDPQVDMAVVAQMRTLDREIASLNDAFRAWDHRHRPADAVSATPDEGLPF